MDEHGLDLQFVRLARALRPEGNLLLKTAGPQFLPNPDSQTIKNLVEKAGIFILSEKRIHKRVRIEHCIVIDTLKNEIIEYREEQRAFSRSDVVNLLRRAGFQTVECLKDLAGNLASDKEFGIYVCAT